MREDFPKPCFAGTDMGDIKGSRCGLAAQYGVLCSLAFCSDSYTELRLTALCRCMHMRNFCRWTIPAGLLTGMEKVHTFTMIVSKGAGEVARTAKTSLQIRPRDPSVPIPTGVLTRDCGGQCSSRHAAVQPLSMSLKLDASSVVSSGNNKQVHITWSLEPPGVKPLVVPATATVASATCSTQVQLIVPQEALPNAAAVNVSAKLTIPGQEGSGSASLTVPLNAAPVINRPLEAELLGSVNSFGKAVFRVSSFIVDDEELTYQFVKGSEFIGQSRSADYTFGVGELPEGNTTITVRATDPEGASTSDSVVISVGAKPADFDVGDQIFALDVQQVAGSNDPSMLARTGAQLGTLDGMSDSSQNKEVGRRLLQEGGATDPADDSVGAIVRLKVMQLLAALGSSSATNLMDAATMRQVRAAASVWHRRLLSPLILQVKQTPTTSLV